MYRERFQSQRKTHEVTYLQLVNWAQGYARKWTAGAQTKEDLLDLFILEHLYEQCPSDLRLWLMDQKPENPPHTGQLANEFVDSRAGDGREESQRSRAATMWKESDLGTSRRGSMENSAQGDPWDMGCYYCGQRGHIQAQCPKLRDRLSRPNPQTVNWVKTQPDEGQHSQVSSSGGLDAPGSEFLVYRVPLRRECLVSLEVDGRKVTGNWDTGAEVTQARPEVVASDRMVPNTYLTLMGVGGTPFKVPMARVHLKWGAKEGPKDMGVHPHLPTEVLMGEDLEDWPSSSQGALVGTHRQSGQGAQRPDNGEGALPEAQDPNPVGRECPGTRLREAATSDPASGREQISTPAPAAEFQAELQKDPSCRKIRDLANLSAVQTMGAHCRKRFLWEKGFLCREWAPPGKMESWGIRRQLVVPRKYHCQLLCWAHDIPLSGNEGTWRTQQRLLRNFYWPGVFTPVRQRCRSCDPCQRVREAWDKRKVAGGPLPSTEEPFQRGAQVQRGALNQESPNHSPPDWNAGRRPQPSLYPRGIGVGKGHGLHKPSHL
uniref:Gypsy retrotransposon integrase-like protein 1 n=1 Tax=Gopherus evgoodei TaxID=1825980 RepID=A0A8C4WPE3_9SAUR